MSSGQSGDTDEERDREALGYVCAHLGELRVTLDDDGSVDSTPLQRLMAAIRDSQPSITALLNHLHEAVRAAGDGVGVYGHTGRSGAGPFRVPGVAARPLDILYVCPSGRCNRYVWLEDSGKGQAECEVTGESMRRERLD